MNKQPIHLSQKQYFRMVDKLLQNIDFVYDPVIIFGGKHGFETVFV